MNAIQLNNLAGLHRYACSGVSITPEPPQVGTPTTITMRLQNSGDRPITVSRVETMISQFGMGARWEQLPDLGPLLLPADHEHIETVSMQWTPLTGGHRCVRANIHIETLPQPLRIGRNLHVIESIAELTRWRVPFHLGNPEQEPMPITLSISNNPEIDAHLIVNARVLGAGEPLWLKPQEEVDAALIIRARTHEALESVQDIEAFIGGRFLDGIRVVVRRPARVSPRGFVHTSPTPITDTILDEAGAIIPV